MESLLNFVEKVYKYSEKVSEFSDFYTLSEELDSDYICNFYDSYLLNKTSSIKYRWRSIKILSLFKLLTKRDRKHISLHGLNSDIVVNIIRERFEYYNVKFKLSLEDFLRSKDRKLIKH